MLRDHRVFWRQFREQFHTTGAIAPSGRFLGRALAHYVGREGTSQRILEVGPGTGAVTEHIVRRLRHQDSLDLVELNDAFVARLRERFASEPPFCHLGPRARVLHNRVEQLAGDQSYDLIVSGLPLNNFSVADVQTILNAFGRLLKPGGVISFFEYVAIRTARGIVSRPKERQRLRGIGTALGQLLAGQEIRRELIWPNLPPAWVHHVRPKPD